MPRPDTVVILAAGQGTRMKTGAPKVLAPLVGRSLLAWVVDQALGLEPKRVIVVVGHGADEVQQAAAGFEGADRIRFVRQEPQNGTGHALQCCLPELGPDPGVVVVLYGDMPLLTRASLERLVEAQAATGGGAAMLTAKPADPRGFGRVVRRADGAVLRIVEQKDATPDELAVREVNLGVYAFAGRELVRHLPLLSNDNAQKEYYLTDVVARLVADSKRVEALVLDDDREAIGVNTLVHLAEARAVLQRRVLEEHMLRGVWIEDPSTTYVDWGVKIGARTHVLPCSVIRSGVVIGEDCEVGPFAHLRGGAVLEDGAAVGNFVEVKNSHFGPRSKAKHLAYVGDADLGVKVNIGAGTVFANYDGKHKHRCVVEDGAFVGSGTVLVAPVHVGRGATTGAGAVVKRGSDIPAGETWIGVPAKKLEKPNGGPTPAAL
ncbi:MAG: NTP transferase domain-containing protein [Planctomycetes bacterium]|nr:NTP transferase domain-containing protein [Planctomycetota bacterium]